METGELELVLNGNGQNKILAKINGQLQYWDIALERQSGEKRN